MIDTVEKLVVWFEENFSCVVGWPMSMTGEGEPPTIEEMNSRSMRDWPGTIRYEAYGFTADDTELDRRRLVIAMHIAFNRKLQKLPELLGTRLYWRYEFKIELCVQDGLSRIYTRIAIPCLASRTDGLPFHIEGEQLRSLYIETI